MRKIVLILVSILFLSNSGVAQTASCLNFDGVNDNCLRPALNSAQNTNMTMEARVNLTGTSTVNQFIAYNGNTGTTGYGLMIFATQSSLTVLYGGLGTAPTPVAISPGNWVHYALVFGNQTFTLYVNGVNTFTYNTGVNPNPPTTGSLCIGSNQLGAENLGGSIDEFRFWDRALCASEISFRSSCGVIGNEPGLVAAYNFNQGTAGGTNTGVTTLNDITANGNNCTLSNFALTGSTSNWINAIGVLGSTCSSPVPLTATITPAATPSICLGASATLSVTGGINTYTWSNSSNSASIAVSPSVTTTYSVIGTNTANGCFAAGEKTVFVYPAAGALNITPSPASGSICTGSSATLAASGGNTYTWSTSSTASQIVVSPTSNTTYTLRSTAPASLGACTNSTTITVTVVVTPTVTVSASPTAICNGATSTITATGATSYSWNTSATTSSIAVNPSVTTTYTVTGNNATCVNTRTVSLVVNPIPTISVTSPTLCTTFGGNVTASGASTYSWSTGANGAVITVTPGSNTSYSVIGTSAAGCVATSSAVSNVTVLTTPNITALASTASLCAGATATLIGGGGNTYVWTGGVTNGVSFVPTSTTTTSAPVAYTVTGTAANGCTNTAVATITVVATPSSAATTSTPQICFGGPLVTISVPTVSGYTYSWNTGTTVITATNAIAQTPTSTTTYTLVRTNTAGPCSFTSNVTVTVNPLPFILATASPSDVCSGRTVTLTAGGTNSYTWLPQGGLPITGQNVNVNPTVSNASTTLVYTLVGSSGTCTSSITQSIVVYPNPTVNVTPNSTVICLNNSVTLTANVNSISPAVSFSWTPGGGNTNSIIAVPTTTTNYSVTVTNSFNCTSLASAIVLVNPLPSAFNLVAVQNKTLICSGAPTTFSASYSPSTAVSYSWSTGQNNTRTITVSPLTTSTYSAIATLTATGCRFTKTITAVVFTPSISITGPTATCFGGTISLCGNGGNTYTWTTPTGPYPFQCNSVSPTITSVYLVTGSSTSVNVTCSNTATTQVTIYSNPTVSAVSSPSAICRGELSALTGSGASTYVWSDQQTGTTVNVTPTVQTTYTVIGTDGNGCKDTNVVLVKVALCVGINGRTIDQTRLVEIFPNPNNGAFTINAITNVELTLFNELGQVIKFIPVSAGESQNINLSELPVGIYYLNGQKDNAIIREKIIISR